MSDSGSNSGAEARMLERRVSNNRADLSGDQQMNHFLAWFNNWSELQKSDFVAVLAEKMASLDDKNHVNGDLTNSLDSLNLKNGGRPPSLFACQVKLFKEWFGGWSDDQKNYLVLRLKDIDPEFFQSYESHMQNPGQDCKPKDYFEPGIPEELIKTPTVVDQDAEHQVKEKSKLAGSSEDVSKSSLTTISE